MTVTNFTDVSTATTTAYSGTDNARSFTGDNQASITFSDGVFEFSDLTDLPTGRGNPTTDITSWTLSGGELTFDAGTKVVAQFAFNDISPEAVGGSHIEIGSVAGQRGLYLTEGSLHQPGTIALIPGTIVNPAPVTPPVVTPPVTQPTPQYVTIHDTTTNADLPDTFSSAYTGPVSGISTQTIAINPDSLNITALTDNAFIKTSSGNDAIALHGGTNVVDAGAGSNFLTSGGGFDTFFLDARNIPAASSAAGPVPGAVWDTIQNFGHSDAVTVFGIGPGTALDWQANQGAVGHTGLTLHANTPNGSEASLTLAGIDSKASLSLSYGQTGGANYLYVKAV